MDDGDGLRAVSRSGVRGTFTGLLHKMRQNSTRQVLWTTLSGRSKWKRRWLTVSDGLLQWHRGGVDNPVKGGLRLQGSCTVRGSDHAEATHHHFRLTLRCTDPATGELSEMVLSAGQSLAVG